MAQPRRKASQVNTVDDKTVGAQTFKEKPASPVNKDNDFAKSENQNTNEFIGCYGCFKIILGAAMIIALMMGITFTVMGWLPVGLGILGVLFVVWLIFYFIPSRKNKSDDPAKGKASSDKK